MIFKGKFEGLSWEKTAFGQYSTWLELERYLNQHSFILNTATHISHNRLAYSWYLCALGISTQELNECCTQLLLQTDFAFPQPTCLLPCSSTSVHIWYYKRISTCLK